MESNKMIMSINNSIHTISIVITNNNVSITSPPKMANVFNYYFPKVASIRFSNKKMF